MTLDLSSSYAYVDAGTGAFGSDARLVNQQAEQRGTGSTSDEKEILLRALAMQATECASPGWDGYGADAVSLATHRHAHRLALTLPPGLPLPTTGAESDGHLTMEWYRDSEHILSVSVGPDGMIFFAALIGDTRRSGSEPFKGKAPEDIVRIVSRLFRAS